MRPKYVPVRLAATVLAVAAAAGCMSVGDGEDGRAKPSHSAGERGGKAHDGGPAGVGGGYMGAAGGDGKHGHGSGRGRPGASASGSGEPSEGASESASAGSGKPGKPGKSEQPGAPEPTQAQPPEPTRSPDPEPPAASPEPPAPSPEPTVAEPSSSAHESGGGTGGGSAPQLVEREPAPEAGVPA